MAGPKVILFMAMLLPMMIIMTVAVVMPMMMVVAVVMLIVMPMMISTKQPLLQELLRELVDISTIRRTLQPTMTTTTSWRIDAEEDVGRAYEERDNAVRQSFIRRIQNWPTL